MWATSSENCWHSTEKRYEIIEERIIADVGTQSVCYVSSSRPRV